MSFSTLSPAGQEAAEISGLFWGMVVIGAALWLMITAVLLYAISSRRTIHTARIGSWLIVGGGVALPAVLLAVLLLFAMPSLAALVDRAPATARVIDVVGEQWWWRVRYPTSTGSVEAANEIRLVAGERAHLRLASDNVIHSFWIPSLAGKMDMIPGRITYLSLEPTRPGVFGGVCAEYCGTSHARMTFKAVVMERAAFDAWLANELQPAPQPSTATAVRGRQSFDEHGCGACHTIRGTEAAGVIGPDLTHVGSRLTVAGNEGTGATALRAWIGDPARTKPDAHMPSFGMLPESELTALAAYLAELR